MAEEHPLYQPLFEYVFWLVALQRSFKRLFVFEFLQRVVVGAAGLEVSILCLWVDESCSLLS